MQSHFWWKPPCPFRHHRTSSLPLPVTCQQAGRPFHRTTTSSNGQGGTGSGGAAGAPDKRQMLDFLTTFFTIQPQPVVVCLHKVVSQASSSFATHIPRTSSHCFRVPLFSFPSAGGTAGSMSYEDFVYFILSEEDKATDASLDYWFRWGGV